MNHSLGQLKFYYDTRREVILSHMSGQEALMELARKSRRILEETDNIEPCHASDIIKEFELNFTTFFEDGKEFLEAFQNPFQVILTFYRLYMFTSSLCAISSPNDMWFGLDGYDTLLSLMNDCIEEAVKHFFEKQTSQETIYEIALKEAYDTTCTICLEEIDTENNFVIIEKCRHAFCQSCFSQHKKSFEDRSIEQ